MALLLLLLLFLHVSTSPVENAKREYTRMHIHTYNIGMYIIKYALAKRMRSKKKTGRTDERRKNG